MRKLAGFGVFLLGYGLAWWSYECLSGRVPGNAGSNSWLPPIKDLFIPGRVAAPKLSAASQGPPGTTTQTLGGTKVFVGPGGSTAVNPVLSA